MTKPKHRANWIYLPDNQMFVNMDTVFSVSKAENFVSLFFTTGGEPVILQGNDAQAVIDFLIL
jgi:hypothetical protein